MTTKFCDWLWDVPTIRETLSYQPCNCCGAQLHTIAKDLKDSTGYGIVIINGIYGKPVETDNFTRAHVKTSAGDLTIQLAHNPL